MRVIKKMIKSDEPHGISSSFHQLYHAHHWFRQSVKKNVSKNEIEQSFQKENRGWPVNISI